MTIYLGPTLVFVGWWWVLRKLVRIGRQQRVTSIADLISARYGKSNGLGVLVTLIAVIAATLYCAAIAVGYALFRRWEAAVFSPSFSAPAGLDAKEQHHGIVIAIAVEAVVKLVALVAVGSFVVWGAGGRPRRGDRPDRGGQPAGLAVAAGPLGRADALSAAAVICLPRMFQVLVVENVDGAHLAAPVGLSALPLCRLLPVHPAIAMVGLERMPPDTNPDMMVLTLPLAHGQGALARAGLSGRVLLGHLDGDRRDRGAGDHAVEPCGDALVAALAAGDAIGRPARRHPSGAAALDHRGAGAGVGLLPPFGRLGHTGGDGPHCLCRHGAGAAGAAGRHLLARGQPGRGDSGPDHRLCHLGLDAVLPSFGQDAVIPAQVFAHGPFGLGWLRPEALFGTLVRWTR